MPQEILVIIAADYTPQRINSTYILGHNVTIQAYKDNDLGGAAVGGATVDPRESADQRGIILYPSQSKDYRQADLRNTYISGKTGDRFTVQYQTTP